MFVLSWHSRVAREMSSFICVWTESGSSGYIAAGMRMEVKDQRSRSQQVVDVAKASTTTLRRQSLSSGS